MARATNFTHLPSHLQAGFGCCLDRGTGHRLGAKNYRLLDVEGFVASPAQRVGGPVLHQGAVFTTNYFTSFATRKAGTRKGGADKGGCTHKSGCHGLCAERQSVVSGVLFSTTTRANFRGVNHNCQVPS
jgi:hypothetical protein